jgi:hypothetical protein
MFADLAFTHPEFAQKRLAAIASASAANPRPNCQRSTIPSGTRQSPTLVINLTKIGSTLSPEEHRLHSWGQSACRGIHNIGNSANSSMKFFKIFPDLTTNPHE